MKAHDGARATSRDLNIRSNSDHGPGRYPQTRTAELSACSVNKREWAYVRVRLLRRHLAAILADSSREARPAGAFTKIVALSSPKNVIFVPPMRYCGAMQENPMRDVGCVR